jgi:hypothetical protein
METETPTRPAPMLQPSRDYVGQLELVTWSTEQNSTAVRLTTDELATIVQLAWDRHGIAANPFDSPGSAEAPEPAEPGRCRCPFPESCSDRVNRAHNVGARA